MEEAAVELGFQMEPSKREGPSKVLTFLGIEIDSHEMEVRLPRSKVEELRQVLASWLKRKHSTKNELEALAGKLQHACRVVRPGRCFMRRLYNLISVVERKTRLVRLNKEIQADVWWWHVWLAEVSILWNCHKSQPDEEIWSDASGSWGCGAWWRKEWFQLKWEETLKESLRKGEEDSIAEREFIPVIIAAMVWGPRWRGKLVRFHSDNTAVVRAVNRVYSRCEPIMHLIRCLVYWAARESFWFMAVHTPGVDNVLADHLSRDNITQFFACAPQGTNRRGVQIPQDISATLAGGIDLNWRSEIWIKRFQSISEKR